jgi:cyclophilin family peptidyl-prolyl cis-trans isomerase
VNDGFYDGVIFHRVMDDFMIQAGNTMPDGTTKESPYGQISKFEGSLNHEDGTISMASTGAGVPGEAQFFICDGAQPGLDGSYAAFGKTIYGIEVVRDIADEPQDGSYGSVGGGKPLNDIIIEKIFMAKD